MMNDAVTGGLDFPRGLPIYDSAGGKLGTVSVFGVQSTYLVMRTGRFFHHDVSIPLSAIQHSDEHGVYLNRLRQEIHNLTLGGWSSLGNIDLNTGVGAGDSPDLIADSVAPISTNSDTLNTTGNASKSIAAEDGARGRLQP